MKIGMWKNDMKHGKGVFTWTNGDKYDGKKLKLKLKLIKIT